VEVCLEGNGDGSTDVVSRSLGRVASKRRCVCVCMCVCVCVCVFVCVGVGYDLGAARGPRGDEAIPLLCEFLKGE
jgi:hypothetical protein